MERGESARALRTPLPINDPRSLSEAIAEEGDSDISEEPEDTCPQVDCKCIKQEFDSLRYKYGVYLQFTYREVKKRKVGCCLGVCSCFLVVLVTCLLVTTLSNLPMVFLRLAEVEQGERDLKLEAGGDASFSYTLDYNRFIVAASNLGPQFDFHSPRVVLPDSGSQTVMYNAKDCNVSTQLVTEPFPDQFKFAYLGLNPPVNGSECGSEIKGCIPRLCGSRVEEVSIVGIDTKAEERQGYGRSWEYEPIPQGETLLSKKVAKLLGVVEGDTVVVSTHLSPYLVGLYRSLGIAEGEWPYSKYAVVNFPLKVKAVVSEVAGKLENGMDRFSFIELNTMLKHLAPFMHPELSANIKSQVADADVYTYVTEINLNVPPTERMALYNSNDYDQVQLRFVDFAGQLVYSIGFNQVSPTAGILEFMYESRFFSLFLGLLISLVILVLTALSILLIYSLLMINVETRTFELGVLRMVGMKRAELVQLVLTQAFFYALPAWIFGLIIGQVIWGMIKQMLQQTLTMELQSQLDPAAVGMATLLGMAIPLLSSVAPIQSALGLNLQDALDTRHSKVKAVEYSFERAEGTTFTLAPVVLGTALSVFGFLIYYLFPYALLSLSLSLLFYIFFGILLSLLFGLVLLSLNVEHLLEMCLTFIFFFWENRAIRTVVVKNLVAHRRRNRKTTMMYAVSLAFIIWISVMWELQTRSVRYRFQQQMGGELDVTPGRGRLTAARAAVVEEAYLRHPELVKDWGWVTANIQDVAKVEDEMIHSLGRFQLFPRAKVRGVTPNLLEGLADLSFLNVKDSNASHAGSLSEQLYNSWSYNRVIMGTFYNDAMGLGKVGSGTSFVQVTTLKEDDDEIDYLSELSPLAVLNSGPCYAFSQFPSRLKQDLFINIPTWISLTQGEVVGMDAVWYEKSPVKLADGWTDEMVDDLRVTMAELLRAHDMPSDAVEINDITTQTKAIRTATLILNIFFYIVTFITLSMCFFSLTASMYTNIHEQSKEIGILRSLGLRICATKRLYVWEAFILVVAASVLGFGSGTLVAWTMTLQRQLFLQFPLQFAFPWGLFLFVVVMALIFAILASYGPTTRLLKRSVVSILRRQD
eukprot:Hpha_TRINITY_DN15370_c3_g4::TRINITY_DN15370_c3_g4_i1::g.87410::m.87410